MFMADKVDGEAGCEIQGESAVPRLSSTTARRLTSRIHQGWHV